MKHLILPALIALPTVAVPHPHVFVETAVEIIVDAQAQVTAIKVIWTYDDFFSLLITEDLGIDSDGDLVLTAAEQEILQSTIKDWPEDYSGDVLVESTAGELALGPRAEHAVVYVDGRVVETHVRPLVQPVAPETNVDIRVFDPGYYTAYTLSGGANVSGSDACDVGVLAADFEAAFAMMDELLYGQPASEVGPEEAFPEVGAAFADRITVICRAS